ncbi:MAG: hypothetical protein LUQ51_06685 [Methanothrix sp.]|nr:hypothetical protein [Methanothrix sp.]
MSCQTMRSPDTAGLIWKKGLMQTHLYGGLNLLRAHLDDYRTLFAVFRSAGSSST